MLEQAGQKQGDFDGHADAMSGKKARPRPDLTLSVMFKGYRDSYLTAYRNAYRAAQYAKTHQDIRDRSDREKAVQALEGQAKSPNNTLFDQGWRDGYVGHASQAGRLERPDDKQAYSRGYKLGFRDRDFARAKALRDQMTRDHEIPDSQADSAREL